MTGSVVSAVRVSHGSPVSGFRAMTVSNQLLTRLNRCTLRP
jgi:hypothetical protein